MTRGAKCRAIPFLKRARLVRGGWCPQDRLLRERPHPAPHHFSQDQRGGRLDQGHTAGLWVAARPSCPQAQSRLHSCWFCPFGSFLFEVVWARATPRARRMLKTTAPPPPPLTETGRHSTWGFLWGLAERDPRGLSAELPPTPGRRRMPWDSRLGGCLSGHSRGLP